MTTNLYASNGLNSFRSYSPIVRRSLVDESQLSGITEGCILMDGTVRKYPV